MKYSGLNHAISILLLLFTPLEFFTLELADGFSLEFQLLWNSRGISVHAFEFS